MKLAAAAMISVLVVGCGSIEPTVATSHPLAAFLDTPDGVVGVFRDADGVHLVLGDQDTGGQHDGRDGEELPTVHLFSMGGDTGRSFNSFVFGIAPPGAASVKLASVNGVGGDIRDGLYVIALREKSVVPDQLHWIFASSSGVTISSGTNVTP